MTHHSIRVPKALWKELTTLKYKHGHKSMAGLLQYLLDEHKKSERASAP